MTHTDRTGADVRVVAVRRIAICLGMALLALAAKNWAFVGWIQDTSASRSPLPYMTTVRMDSGVTAAARAAMVIVLSPEPTREVCEHLKRANRGTGWAQSSIVVHNRDGSLTVDACGSDQSASIQTVPVPVSTRSIAPFPEEGFVLVDATRRVYYGSYRLADLDGVDALLELRAQSR